MSKRVLFIDRDGTLIIEPEDTQQVDALEKLEFYPSVIRNLYNIRSYLSYELVMVSNQDGLGTNSFPEEQFLPTHRMMLKIFENEGVIFDDILIDRSKPEDNSPNRKPQTGMFGRYLDGSYDLKNSFVIGDRITDIQLAKNLGARAILIGEEKSSKELDNLGLGDTCVLISKNWSEIFSFLMFQERGVEIERHTKETNIRIALNLNGLGKTQISTGLGFFDHMLEQIGKHSGSDLNIDVRGDLGVDEHHTIEDTALALGAAFNKALINKRGIERYGYVLPMDDSRAEVVLDFGGRSWIIWDVTFVREYLGDVPTEMFYHFFKSFSETGKCNLHIRAWGTNDHHKAESIFKAFGRAIKMAVKRYPFDYTLPSTKGAL